MTTTGNNVQATGPGHQLPYLDPQGPVRVGELVVADHVMTVTTTIVRQVVVRGRGPNRALGTARGRVDTGAIDLDELDIVSEEHDVRYQCSREAAGAVPDIDDGWGRKR